MLDVAAYEDQVVEAFAGPETPDDVGVQAGSWWVYDAYNPVALRAVLSCNFLYLLFHLPFYDLVLVLHAVAGGVLDRILAATLDHFDSDHFEAVFAYRHADGTDA